MFKVNITKVIFENQKYYTPKNKHIKAMYKHKFKKEVNIYEKNKNNNNTSSYNTTNSN